MLESECSVEMDKLLSLCRHGIPDRLRGEAWKYLLGVMRPEKSQELSLGKLMEQRYQQLERAGQADAQSELTRQIKAEVRGYLSGELFFRESRTHQRLERLLRTYLYRHTSGYIPGMVHLLGPFVQVYRDSDTDAHYGARAFGSRRPLPHTIQSPSPSHHPTPPHPGSFPPLGLAPTLDHTHTIQLAPMASALARGSPCTRPFSRNRPIAFPSLTRPPLTLFKASTSSCRGWSGA